MTISEDVKLWKAEAEGVMPLEVITRKLVKTQQTEKTSLELQCFAKCVDL
jgi:hypothetical protein